MILFGIIIAEKDGRVVIQCRAQPTEPVTQAERDFTRQIKLKAEQAIGDILGSPIVTGEVSVGLTVTTVEKPGINPQTVVTSFRKGKAGVNAEQLATALESKLGAVLKQIQSPTIITGKEVGGA